MDSVLSTKMEIGGEFYLMGFTTDTVDWETAKKRSKDWHLYWWLMAVECSNSKSTSTKIVSCIRLLKNKHCIEIILSASEMPTKVQSSANWLTFHRLLVDYLLSPTEIKALPCSFSKSFSKLAYRSQQPLIWNKVAFSLQRQLCYENLYWSWC